MPLPCYYPVTYYHTLVMRTAGPLVIFAVLLLVIRWANRQYNLYRRSHPEYAAARKKIGDSCGTVIFLLIFLLYPSCCTYTFKTFICRDQGDGRIFLVADLALSCETNLHTLMMLYAGVMVLVYPIGTPCIYIALMRRYRGELERLRNDELTAVTTNTSVHLRRSNRVQGAGKRLKEGPVRIRVLSATSRAIWEERHLALSPGCLSWYNSAAELAPVGQLFLGRKSLVHLDESGHDTLSVDGKTSYQRKEHDISIQITILGSEAKMQAKLVAEKAEQTGGGGRGLDSGPSVDEMTNAMLKEWKKQIERQKQLSLSEMAAESENTMDVEARKRALQVLPLYFKKIIGPYELRVYWFEVVECIRKVLLVGLPVFFRPGTPEQLVLGLIICFISFGAYMQLSPFAKSAHDLMSQLCQFQIFFALLAGVVLKTDPTESETEVLGTILTVMCAVPPLIGLAFSNARVRALFDAKRRQAAVARVNKLLQLLRDRLFWGRTSRGQRSKLKAADAWRKSLAATGAKDAARARSLASLLGAPADAATPVGVRKLAATSAAAGGSKPSLLAQIRRAKAASGSSATSAAEADLEAPSQLPKGKASFIVAAASAPPSSPGRRSRVAPCTGDSAGPPPAAAWPEQKQVDLESRLSPKAVQQTPTRPLPDPGQEQDAMPQTRVHISDV